MTIKPVYFSRHSEGGVYPRPKNPFFLFFRALKSKLQAFVRHCLTLLNDFVLNSIKGIPEAMKGKYADALRAFAQQNPEYKNMLERVL